MRPHECMLHTQTLHCTSYTHSLTPTWPAVVVYHSRTVSVLPGALQLQHGAVHSHLAASVCGCKEGGRKKGERRKGGKREGGREEKGREGGRREGGRRERGGREEEGREEGGRKKGERREGERREGGRREGERRERGGREEEGREEGGRKKGEEGREEGEMWKQRVLRTVHERKPLFGLAVVAGKS